MEENGLTTEAFAKHTAALKDRLVADQIVSEDIKELAACVALIADWMAKTEVVLGELCERPPGRVFNINYTKK